jgi:acetylornithine deacetylase
MVPARPDGVKIAAAVADDPLRWLDAHEPDLVGLAAELVRLPSENRPPHGDEAACQAAVATRLRDLGLEPDVFRPDAVPAAAGHELWWPGRDYAGRECVTARRAGRGGGRSLLLTGHVDVVPALGEAPHGFYDGAVVDGRLYGRGALDMKGGVAAALHALRCLVECGVPLAGDVLFETVVDEEFGGANGTLACRLRGPQADAAVLTEPTALVPCHATRGGIQYRIHASGGLGAMPLDGGPTPSALVTLARVAVALDAAERGRGAPIIQMLLRSGEELPWGTGESVPADGVLELWAEILPGTTREAVDAELHAAVASVAADGIALRLEQRTRFLEAPDIGADHAIVAALGRALAAESRPAAPALAPYACDAFVLDRLGVPTVVCGPGGADAHAPGEHVLIEDLQALARTLVRLALDWCGTASG